MPYAKEVGEYGRKFDFAVPAIQKSNDNNTVRPGLGMMMGPQVYGGQLQGLTDQPEWYFFQIERSEVADENDPARNWVRLYKDAVVDLFDNWAIKPPQTEEIVDADFLLPPEASNIEKWPYLFPTWPLPPLYLKNWGLEASHPKVKLVATEETPMGEPGQPAQAQELDLGGGNEGGAPAVALRHPMARRLRLCKQRRQSLPHNAVERFVR